MTVESERSRARVSEGIMVKMSGCLRTIFASVVNSVDQENVFLVGKVPRPADEIWISPVLCGLRRDGGAQALEDPAVVVLRSAEDPAVTATALLPGEGMLKTSYRDLVAARRLPAGFKIALCPTFASSNGCNGRRELFGPLLRTDQRAPCAILWR